MMHDVMLLHDTNRLTLPLPRFLKRGCDIRTRGRGAAGGAALVRHRGAGGAPRRWAGVL
jgi:hypothetical protein